MPAHRKTDDPNSKAPKTEISSRSRQRKAKDKATENISSLINGLHHMSRVNGCKKETTEDKISLANKLEMIIVKPEKKPSEVKPKAGILHVSDVKKEIIMSSSPTCPSRKKVNEFECDFCEFVAENGFLLGTHMEIKHTNNHNYFPCSMCSFTTTKQMILDEHNLAEHKKGKWPCTFCTQTFHRARDLIHHNTVEHSEAVKNTPANLGNKRGNYERTYRDKVTKTKDK